MNSKAVQAFAVTVAAVVVGSLIGAAIQKQWEKSKATTLTAAK